MMNVTRFVLFGIGVALELILLSGCFGDSPSDPNLNSSQADWYYHWNCNGDPDCLATNPDGTATGTINEGPQQQSCTPMLTFASKNWGDAATNSCDQDPNATAPKKIPKLTSITVAPSTKSLVVGGTQQFTATGHYSDGSTADLTSQVAWTVSNSIASVSSGGLVTASAIGSAAVKATLSSLVGTANISVGAATLQSISVTPSTPNVTVGLTQAFTATGHYSDGTTIVLTDATWTSSVPANATINSTTGIATAVTIGSSNITATKGSISGNTTMNVVAAALQSITVTPANSTVPVGYTRSFTAIGSYSDGTALDITASCSWSSDTPAKATVNSAGVATGVAAGTATITASSGGISGSTVLTVTSANLTLVTVSPVTPRIALGSSIQFLATGHYDDGSTSLLLSGVTWTSSVTVTASITGTTGVATGLQLGNTTITATYGAHSGNTDLYVTNTPTGYTWTNQTAGGANLLKVAWSGSKYATVGSGSVIYTSLDGISWTPQTAPAYGGPGNVLQSILWSGSLFVTVGNEKKTLVSPGVSYRTGVVATSSDGVTWTNVPNNHWPQFNSIAFSGTTYVAVGFAGGIMTSTDTTSWTSRTSGTTNDLYGVTWSGSQFLAVGSSGLVLTSPDGVTWYSHAAGSAQNLLSTVWTGNKFIAVGATGTVMTSPTGVNWTQQSIGGLLINLNDVACSTLLCVMVGDSGQILATPNGVSWSGRVSGTTNNLNGITWSGTEFQIVGTSGITLKSQ